ncbi:unnamed protein product [Vitrella brassicaformis CCMP3155]|uniref:Reverse transcriptase domain-containing protein n=1 Tax=Vitrella brassicaformis (strain CCMP3155) TaxID=1169540 RepID=A0A0G4H7R4_VITBC|nr:unnamed protein product [Vitrella brassicaformis CCMP3155]|eukprot:CEM39915.1 unnamed protein product [Vitrella brassicaformis CCMP3155]
MKDGFLHLPVDPREADLLGFQSPINVKYYRYQFVPFGLATAPWLFCHLMEYVKTRLSERGVHAVLVYVDDWYFVGQTHEDVQHALDVAREVFAVMGLEESVEKAEEPTTKTDFVGLVIDTRQRTISMKESKRDKLLADIDQLLDNRRQETHKLQHVLATVGKLTHYAFLHPAGRHKLRRAWDIQAALVQEHCVSATQGSRKDQPSVQISREDQVWGDMRWWRQLINRGPSRPLHVGHDGHFFLWEPTSHLTSALQADVLSLDPQRAAATAEQGLVVLFTDASDRGWSGTVGSRKWQGAWSTSSHEDLPSINFRELLAVLFSIQRLVKTLNKGARLLVRSDSVSTVGWINDKEESSPAVQRVLARIFALLEAVNGEIVAVHIPGKDNTVADELSRFSLFADSRGTRLSAPSVETLATAVRLPRKDLEFLPQLQLQQAWPHPAETEGSAVILALTPEDVKAAGAWMRHALLFSKKPHLAVVPSSLSTFLTEEPGHACEFKFTWPAGKAFFDVIASTPDCEATENWREATPTQVALDVFLQT